MTFSTLDPIRLGHSPDPDDAFMFYGLAREQIDTEGLRFIHQLEDIETLNRRAFNGELEVTAVSVHAYAHLCDRYILLNTGASMGVGYGPMIVARQPVLPHALAGKTIAIPGEHTSAWLALQLYAHEKNIEFEIETVPFDQIFDAVRSGSADAGLIIHEGQLTFEEEGLHCLVDLGKWWMDSRDGLPLPLGVNVVRRDLGPDVCRRIDRIQRRSIEYSMAHRKDAVAYAMQWGRGLEEKLADQFIGMYVNDWTLETGTKARPAIERFLAEAAALDLIPATTKVEFVS